MQERCKQALVAVFGQQKVDEFPEPLLKLMGKFYCIAREDGINEVSKAPGYDYDSFHAGRERGYYEAREELQQHMEKEVAYRLEDERRWREQEALQMTMPHASFSSLDNLNK